MSRAPAPTEVCCLECIVLAEGSDIRYAQMFPYLNCDFEPIKNWLRALKDTPRIKSKQNGCGYRERMRYTRHSACPDSLRDYWVNTRAVSQQPPPDSLTHYLREWTQRWQVRMVLVGRIPLEEAAAATLVAVEELFLTVLETLEVVETWVIPIPHQMAI